MKPLVLHAETRLFDGVETFWHIIWHATDKAHDTEVSKEEAQECIREYALPLDYKDANGEVWADPHDNPYMHIKARALFRKDDRRKLQTMRDSILADFGGEYNRKDLQMENFL